MATKTKRTTKNKRAAAKSTALANSDGVYLLKLVLYTIVGTQWLWFEIGQGNTIPVPLGLLLGLLFARYEHFKVDRKIEYALLLVAMLVGFIAHIGIFVTI